MGIPVFSRAIHLYQVPNTSKSAGVFLPILQHGMINNRVSKHRCVTDFLQKHLVQTLQYSSRQKVCLDKMC